MKKIIVPVFALMLSVTAANAQSATTPAQAATPAAAPAAQAQATQDAKVKVEIKDLPAAVQTALSADEYKGWTASEAWLIKGAAEYYVVEMSKGAEKTSVKLDKDGKKIG